MVLPILREQRAGPGKDEEHLVSWRTRALKVQPDIAENVDGLSDDQSVRYTARHQEETWYGLETSAQDGRHQRFTTGLARSASYLSAVCRPRSPSPDYL